MSTTATAGPDRLLSDVLATYENAPDARLREIMEAAVRHLHAFVREVGLTTMRAAHVHLIVSAPRFHTVTTHLFDAASDYLDGDAVFGVRESLIVPFEPDDGVPAATFDIVLTPDTPR